MIVDGKALARAITARIHEDVQACALVPVVRAVTVTPGPATESYLRIKEKKAVEAGMKLEVIRLPDTATTDEVLAALLAPQADALLVQLPLPAPIDTEKVLNAIPLSLDADVLSQEAHMQFEQGAEGALLPPVVAAVKEILDEVHVDVRNKRVYVLGKGWLVGQPVAQWMRTQGAIVTVVTREDTDLSVLKNAEIIVSGAGEGGIILPEHLSSGVVLIDAGTSESAGAIVGDAHPTCASIASVFTPVPGGVGPVAVACLFKNAATLIKTARLQSSQKAV